MPSPNSDKTIPRRWSHARRRSVTRATLPALTDAGTGMAHGDGMAHAGEVSRSSKAEIAPRAHRRHGTLALALGLVFAAAGCTAAAPEPTATPPSAGSIPAAAAVVPQGEPQSFATGLEVPWSVVFAEGTALVSERDSGRIVEIADDGGARRVGVIADADGRGEGGLLGLALGPDGGLYVYFSTPTDNRIERYDLEGSPGSFALGDPEVIIDSLPVAGNHNGGRIAFGPDGMLYVGVGDAAQGDRAQDVDDLGGKILRLTPEGGIPDDNPFPGSLVWSYGHRNVQGLAWAADGTMFATEFGQDTWDELNIIEPGENYGWPVVEGMGGGADFIDPVQQWTPDAASPSGMAIVGDTIFIANLRGEVLRAVPIADPSQHTDYYVHEFGRLRDVAPGPDGDLWFMTNNTDGRGSPGPEDDRILRVALGS